VGYIAKIVICVVLYYMADTVCGVVGRHVPGFREVVVLISGLP